MTITLTHALPSLETYKTLRRTTGWGVITHQQVKLALANSLQGITAYENHKPVGMARVIGDGVLNIYIQDVVVAPTHRGQGVGRAMISALIRDLKDKHSPNCTVGLFSALGQEGFYSVFSFAVRPDKDYGAGMFATLADLTDRTKT